MLKTSKEKNLSSKSQGEDRKYNNSSAYLKILWEKAQLNDMMSCSMISTMR
jgi:hypothetical protein